MPTTAAHAPHPAAPRPSPFAAHRTIAPAAAPPPPAVQSHPTLTPSTTVAAPPPPAGPSAPAAIEPSVWATVLVLTVLLPAALAALAGQHLAFSRRSR
ncbi:hypothetical protein [Kitasatospora griseola]|uniref:hypothetical protein n=1 Tax=Kitasatospora griseola TaxID=2064 RepID=UPI003829ACAF